MISVLIHAQLDQVREWCRGRNGYVRIPMLVFFAYIFFRHLASPVYQSIFGPLNLGLHEFGHMMFMTWAGAFMSFLGGTLMEVGIPVAGMWNFYFQKDYFGLTLCFGWLSTVLFGVARYVGDARAEALPLVQLFGVDSKHDWNYLLGAMGILAWDGAISAVVWGLACISMIVCLWTSGWIIWQMLAQRNNGQ